MYENKLFSPGKDERYWLTFDWRFNTLSQSEICVHWWTHNSKNLAYLGRQEFNSTLHQSSHGLATRAHGFSTKTRALAREIPPATQATSCTAAQLDARSSVVFWVNFSGISALFYSSRSLYITKSHGIVWYYLLSLALTRSNSQHRSVVLSRVFLAVACSFANFLATSLSVNILALCHSLSRSASVKRDLETF